MPRDLSSRAVILGEQRQPEIHVLELDTAKSSGRDADDGVRLPLDLQRLSNDAGIAAEATLPERMSQDGDPRAGHRMRFAVVDETPDFGVHSQCFPESRRDHDDFRHGGIDSASRRQRRLRVRSDGFESLRSFRQQLEKRIGSCAEGFSLRAFFPEHLPEVKHAIGCCHMRRRRQDQVSRHVEHAGHGADADGDRQNGGCRYARLAADSSKRVDKIPPESVQPTETREIVNPFSDGGRVAELTAGRRVCLFRVHARLFVQLRSHREVGFELLAHVLGDRRTAEQSLE